MVTDATTIEKSIILLVEGKDEELFFEKYFLHLKEYEGHIWDNLENLQVISFNGTPNFERNLGFILTAITGYELIQKIGIIYDADTDAGRAFSNVTAALTRMDIACPERQLTPTTGNPSVNIMIVPETGSGSIENFFLESVKDDLAMECLDSYFSCLNPFYDSERLQRPKNIYKAKMQAFLSSRKTPKASFGGGCQEGYWTYSHPAFDRIKEFLRQLIN